MAIVTATGTPSPLASPHLSPNTYNNIDFHEPRPSRTLCFSFPEAPSSHNSLLIEMYLGRTVAISLFVPDLEPERRRTVLLHGLRTLAMGLP